MLKIRLARGGTRKNPFFRIVLTEHTKPVKSGFKEIVGRYNPITKETSAEVDKIKAWIEKGARPSNRAAKILFAYSNDTLFKEFIVENDRVRKPRNAPEEEPATEKAPVEQPAESKEEENEEVKEEKEEEKVEDKNEEVKEEKEEDKVEDKKEEEEKKEDEKEENDEDDKTEEKSEDNDDEDKK